MRPAKGLKFGGYQTGAENAKSWKYFQYEETEEGSGKRSVCSPMIANIDMHYVLVWCFLEKGKPHMKGYAGIVVYVDDFVACYQ